VRQGIERLRSRDTATAAALDAWLERVRTEHEDRIVPIDAEVAEEWGRLNASETLPVVDSLLAATAKVHGMTLATRNVKDLARTGVVLMNPFESPITRPSS
jgi:predicted nucleic acid-binding protein